MRFVTSYRRAGSSAALALAMAGMLASAAWSEGVTLGGGSGKSRAAQFRAQVALLDGRLSQQYSNSSRLKPKTEEGDAGLVRYEGQYRGQYLDMAKTAARKYGVPENLFLKLVQQESGWDPDVVSAKGAVGLAQLLPTTAERLGIDATDPQANLDGGARYLSMMYTRFGSWKLALAAYNAGPEAVEAAGVIPDFAETKDYVAAILG